MSAGHTPGPWKVDGNTIRDNRSNYVAHLKLYLDKDIEQANARLIAAAPALLAALEEMLGAGDDPGRFVIPSFETIASARAVLARLEEKS